MTALFLLASTSLRAEDLGTCGDNITWTLDAQGVLTLEGTGAMPDYSGSPWGKVSLTKVVIGEGITTIGNEAFYDCKGLTSVDIPNTVTSIGENAFYNCISLSSVDIPNSVTSIGKSAFSDCEGLTSVTIPNSLTSLENYVFYYCKKLTSVTIPNSVTSIGQAAFYNCKGLTSITIPSSVTSIGKTAFTWCNLNKIECLAETPPTCVDNSFSQTDTCMLYVPKSSIETYKEATGWKDFKNIEALSGGTQSGQCGDNITWTLDAQGVLTLEGTGAMPDYKSPQDTPWSTLSFTNAVIGEGITTIGDYAFADLSGLTSVTIPSSVTTINQLAFYGCDGLKSMTIPTTVTSIGRAAFGYCTGLTSVVIPDSVTSIAWGTFGCCTGLTSVTIPSSVTTIEDQAFALCTGLKEVTCLAVTPPTCYKNVFYNVSKDSCTLSVPEASVEAYRTADIWKDFNNIVSGINGVSQESNVGVSASNGVITVTGTADNAVVEVYGISGMLVYRGTSNTVAVPSAGIYVVKAAGKTVKVNAAK